MKVKFFKRKTFFEVATAIFVNLTSGWFGILVVAPGFLGVKSITEYLHLLIANLPYGIFSLIVTLWLAEKAKKI